MPYKPDQIAAVESATESMKETFPALYWLPRLSRWTGARLNELHQLRKRDIAVRDGIPGLMITDEGDSGQGVPMRLKNPGSRRWVPLARPVSRFAQWVENALTGHYFRQSRTSTGLSPTPSPSGTGDSCAMCSRLRTTGSTSTHGGIHLQTCAGPQAYSPRSAWP